VALVPRTLVSMITGRSGPSPEPEGEAP
jgi:hypothetical protein